MEAKNPFPLERILFPVRRERGGPSSLQKKNASLIEGFLQLLGRKEKNAVFSPPEEKKREGTSSNSR